MKRALVWSLTALLFVGVSTFGICHTLLADDPSAVAKNANKGDAQAEKSPPALRTGEYEIQKALTDKTSLEFQEVPLKDAIEYLSMKHRLEIQFDMEALKTATIEPAALPITFKTQNISLKAALNRILSEHALATIVQNEVLLITTKEKADTTLVNKVYDVRDLLTPIEDQAAFESLKDLITTAIEPPSWNSEGGPGALVSVHPGMLAVTQTQQLQAEVVDLLVALRAAKEQIHSGKFDTPIPVGPDRAEKEIEKQLAEKVDLSFAETPLFEVMQTIQKSQHIPLQFDNEALRTATIDPTTLPITGRWTGISLRSALNQMLKQHALTWIIADEGMLITTREKADTTLNIKLYPVGDLIANTNSSGATTADDTGSDTDELIDAMTAIVASFTWSEMGGPGTIQSYGEGKNTLLAITQAQEVQAQVADFLAQLRDVRHKQQENAAHQQAVAKEPEKAVLKVYALRLPAAGAPAMTPVEVADVVKSLVEPKSWTGGDAYIRGVTGKLIVRQVPSVQRQVETLLKQLNATDSPMPGGFGGLGGKASADASPSKSGGGF